MKAQVIRMFGDPAVFETAEMPVPELIPGHVLVKVMASSVNPVDFKIRAGQAPAIAHPFPAILNGDFSGVVISVGEQVTRWKTGDAVFGCAGGVGSLQGALAEFMLVDERLIARKPDQIDFQTAALYPLAFITAWESVMSPGFIQAGDKVLIHGASGGVGHLAAQLAHLKGATVYGTVTSEEKGLVAKQFGTDIVIVSGKDQMAAAIEKETAGCGFDAVIDTIGNQHLLESFEAVRLNGSVCTINARTTLDIGLMHQKALTLRVVFMLLPMLHDSGREQHGAILREAASLMESGRIRIHQAERSFSFSEVDEAHRYLDSHQAVGKISLVNRWNPASSHGDDVVGLS